MTKSDAVAEPLVIGNSSFVISAAPLRSRVFQDLFDGGVAGKNAADPILPQRNHPELDRLLFQDNRRRAFIDQFANGVGNLHELVNAFASLVAGLVAGIATFAVVKFLTANVPARDLEFSQKR